MVEGLANGTDLYFNKSAPLPDDKTDTCIDRRVDRLSGLWGAQTPLGIWLEENQITVSRDSYGLRSHADKTQTLFFGGVNADQCVWGTFLDAYYKVRLPHEW